MKYEIWENDVCVAQTNDFRTAMASYYSHINEFSKLEQKTDANFLYKVELRFIEEKRKLYTLFGLLDL